MNTPPFNEKLLLLCLLNMATKQYGNETRLIFDHQFNSIEPIDFDTIQVIASADDVVKKKIIHQWLNEAEFRNLVTKASQNHLYRFTKEGYKKANKYKHPIITFYKDHWKWFIGISLTLLNAGLAIAIKIMLSKC